MNINAIIRKITGRFHYGERLQPERDWFVLLGVAVLAFAVSFALNALLFLRVASGQTFGGGPTPTSPAFNAVPLQAVDALFAARAQEAARYQNEYPFTDPSK